MDVSPSQDGWQWLLCMALCSIALLTQALRFQGRETKAAKHEAFSFPGDESGTQDSPPRSSTTLSLPFPDTEEINLRLSGLPAETTKAEVGQLIRELRIRGNPIYWPLPGVDDESMVKTLTQSLDGEDWVATVRFYPTHAVGNTSTEDKQLSGQITFRNRVVRYDEAFHHATPLFPQGAAGDEIANIFAITGLGGRPIDSWKGSNVMWLRDFLGQDLQRKGFPTRIFTYGYPSQLTVDGNTDTLRQYAERLLTELMRLRRQQCETGGLKPFVFVTHSFGGLILKQALKIAYHERRDHEEYKEFCHSIVLTVFMGVPNLGLENTAFLEMTQNQTNEALMELIGFRSRYLRELDEDFKSFRQNHSDCKVLVVYETRLSPAVKSQPDGKKIMRVPEWSACSPGLEPVVRSIPSSTDHSGLAKFQSHDDIIYGEIVANIETSLQGTTLIPTHLTTLSLKPFHGRQDIIATIYQRLSSDDGDGNVAQVFVLCDFAGTGKTAIAQKYATKHANAYAAVVWIDGSSEDSLRNGCVEWEKISKLPGKVLLVYDGLDGEGLFNKVKKYHSPGWTKSIRVLVTTSNQRVSNLAPQENVKKVEPLSSEDSQRLICPLGSLDQETKNTLFELAQSLDGWPLGLCAAAKMTHDGHSISSIMRWIREEGFLSHDHELSPGSSIYDAFEKNMKVLEPRVTERARVLFTLCAFLGGEVPKSMFELAFAFFPTARSNSRYSRMWNLVSSVVQVPSTNRICIGSEFAGFLMFNLIKDVHDGVWVQPQAVAMWARSRSREDRISFISMAATFLYMWAERQRLTKGEGARVDTKHVWGEHFRLVRYADLLIDYCDDVLGLDFAALVPIQCVTTFAAWYVHGDTRRDRARTMLRTALSETDKKETNRTDPSLSDDEAWAILHAADARRILAWADRVSGELQEAEKQQDSAIKGLRKLDDQHSSLISDIAKKEMPRAIGELATIYRDQARRRPGSRPFDNAIRKQDEALLAAKQAFEDHSSETRHERACLANLHRFAGEWDETLENDQENLDSWASHPRTGQQHLSEGRKLKANLATTYFDRKEYTKAIRLEEEVLVAVQAHRGRRHPETATSMYRLARTYSEAGTRLDEAIKLVTQAVEIHEEFGCEEHERKEATNLKADLLRERTPRRASTC